MIFPFPVKIKALKCQATDCKCQCGGTVEDVEEAIQHCWRKGACGFTRINTNKLLKREPTSLVIPALLETRPPKRVDVKPSEDVIEIEFSEPLVIYIAPPKQQKKKKK